MRFSVLSLSALIICAAALSSCGVSVTRKDRDQGRDLSGKWNDTDSRLVAEKLVASITKEGGWIDAHIAKAGKKPVVQVGNVIIDTMEVINDEVFKNELRNALLNSQKVRVRSSLDRSKDTREVLKDGDKYVGENKKEMFNELGSDYILTGSINTQNDSAGRKKDKVYAVDMELRTVESQELIWADRKTITKEVDRSIFN